MNATLHVSCKSCGRTNRIPTAKAGRHGRCGHCKAELPTPAEPVDVATLEDLDNVLQQSELPVLVDFWASWCGPCRAVAPEVARVAERNAGRWLVVKANTEQDPRLGAKHGVRSIPMMAVFDGGRELARTAGARPAGQIEAFVQQSLGR